MTTKHTPGPWVLDTYGNLKVGFDYVKFSGLCLSSGREANANTRLIAAAPELLEALTVLSDWVESLISDNECRPLENARAAIVKATGETQ